jgi:hypothetical protein
VSVCPTGWQTDGRTGAGCSYQVVQQQIDTMNADYVGTQFQFVLVNISRTINPAWCATASSAA